MLCFQLTAGRPLSVRSDIAHWGGHRVRQLCYAGAGDWQGYARAESSRLDRKRPVAGQRPIGLIVAMQKFAASLQSLGAGIQSVACLHPPHRTVAQSSCILLQHIQGLRACHPPCAWYMQADVHNSPALALQAYHRVINPKSSHLCRESMCSWLQADHTTMW